MSQFDAAARPLYKSFSPTADFAEFSHAKARIDVNEKNAATAWGAERSEKFDLTEEDLADDLLFNEVIWKSVKGAKSEMPLPIRRFHFRY